MSIIDEIINEINQGMYPFEEVDKANGLDREYMVGYNDACVNIITDVEGFRSEVEG